MPMATPTAIGFPIIIDDMGFIMPMLIIGFIIEAIGFIMPIPIIGFIIDMGFIIGGIMLL